MATVAVGPTDQAMHALEQANRVRSVRAQLKREIASGSLTASAVIERCPREAEGMTVRELLQSQPRWGPIDAPDWRYQRACPKGERSEP
jgi:hypothetical protein